MKPTRTRNTQCGTIRRSPDLGRLLAFWGVRACGKGKHPKIKNTPVSTLWDLFDSAKQEHRRRILNEHPDRGGSWRNAAQINSLWDRTVKLFARHGIKPEGTKT